MMSHEHCAFCDAPTGRAGKGEDSLYEGDIGPFCEGCWDRRYVIGRAGGRIDGLADGRQMERERLEPARIAKSVVNALPMYAGWGNLDETQRQLAIGGVCKAIREGSDDG